MSPHTIFDDAPLGALIRYSDGTARPPARFADKRAAWCRRNGLGRLVRKEPARQPGYDGVPFSFFLNEAGFTSGSGTIETNLREHRLDSDLHYEIVERPAIGTVRVILPVAGNIELLHLAESLEAAELWAAKNRHDKARLEEVTADEVSADAVEGRVAA